MRFRQACILTAIVFLSLAATPGLQPLVLVARADERPILLAQAPGEETTQPGGVESYSPQTPAGEQTTDPGGTEAQIDVPDDSTKFAHQPRDDSLASREIFTPVSGEPPASSSFWTYVIYGVVALVIVGFLLRRRAT